MNKFPPVFLVEKLEPGIELIEESDVTLHLAVAVQKVLDWMKDEGFRCTPRVSLDSQGLVEGVAFFTEDKALVARITVYWLEREDLSEVDAEVQAVAAAPATRLEARLRALF